MNFYETSVEELVREDHYYRKLLRVVDFERLTERFKNLYSPNGRKGYPISSGFKALLLQFLEDLSDRQMENFLEDSNAAKLFCGFNLKDQTPDHSYLHTLRARIGAHRLSELFNQVVESLKKANLIRGVFTFVDASMIQSKINVWEARDKALADAENDQHNDDGTPKMNNQNISKYSSDPDARFGCKGKDKFWIGYKRHISADMHQGFITKVDVTPANVTDAKGLALVCPNGGMVFLDKAYCSTDASEILAQHHCHSGAILKNNMKAKNKDKDRWLSSVRMPFEGIFSKQSKLARFRTTLKVRFQALMQALVVNLKRLLAIGSPPLVIA